MSGGHFPAGFTRPTELPAYQAEPPVFRSIAVTSSSSSSHDSHIDSSWNDTYHTKTSSSSSKELTSTTYVGTPQVKLPTRLKDLPSFYQPSTLICATSIHDAWHSITTHFIKSHVNMTQDMSKAKIHGIYSIPHDATLLTFRVRLYNAAHLYPTSTTSIIAIEVTRRSGCIVAFQEFYRICTLVMGERLLTTPIPVAANAMPILRQVNNSISSTSSSISIPTMPTLPLPDHTEVELDSTTISTITQQLRSLDLLTCRTGMASLVHLITRHPSNQNLLIQYILSQHSKTPITPVTSLTATTPLLVIILYLLSTRMDIDLHRGCTTILSILCEHSSFMDLIIPCASMIQTLFMILDNHMNKISSTPNHFVSIFQRDIHRSIASIFGHLAISQPDRFTTTLKTASSSQPQGISQYLYILDYYYNHSEPSVASQFDQMRKLCSY